MLLRWDKVWFKNCSMVSANDIDQELEWCREVLHRSHTGDCPFPETGTKEPPWCHLSSMKNNTAMGIPHCMGESSRDHLPLASWFTNAMETSADLHEALAVLGLRTTPRTREDLARLVAARHPASQPWNAVQTAAYRRVWEELERGGEGDAPMAA